MELAFEMGLAEEVQLLGVWMAEVVRDLAQYQIPGRILLLRRACS